jgi:hypothetical protein
VEGNRARREDSKNESREEERAISQFCFFFYYLVHFEFFFRPSHSVRRSVARFAECPASTSVAAVDTNKRQLIPNGEKEKRETNNSIKYVFFLYVCILFFAPNRVAEAGTKRSNER